MFMLSFIGHCVKDRDTKDGSVKSPRGTECCGYLLIVTWIPPITSSQLMWYSYCKKKSLKNLTLKKSYNKYIYLSHKSIRPYLEPKKPPQKTKQKQKT